MTRTWRVGRRGKRSRSHYIRSVLRQVWRHPSNRGRRGRAIVRSIAWQMYKRSMGRPLLLRFGAMKVRCYPDTGSAANIIYFTERFDPVEFDFMDCYLRPGDRVVDAGANIGLYSLWMAQLVGESGRIDAFEGSPKACVRLRENVALNCLQELIEVHAVAISDRPGTVKFSLDYDVADAIVPSGVSGVAHRWVEVDAVALDDVIG